MHHNGLISALKAYDNNRDIQSVLSYVRENGFDIDYSVMNTEESMHVKRYLTCLNEELVSFVSDLQSRKKQVLQAIDLINTHKEACLAYNKTGCFAGAKENHE